MNQVKAKVYYEVETGTILLITSEGQGWIAETTKEEDIKIYPELKDKDINNIDFIELEFGALETIFNNFKAYHVNIEKKELIVEYYTPEELQVIKNQNQEIQILNNRVNDISEYLNQQSAQTVVDFENYILQNELNKIMEGMN